MENFKTVFLTVMKKIVDFVSIVALILTVLSGALVIFYNEILNIFNLFGWPQERLAWLTITLGSLGTAGVILGRVSGGLKQAVIVAKTNQEISQKSFEKELSLKVDNIQRLYDKKIADIEAKSVDKLEIVSKELKSVKAQLIKSNKFNELQARKYLAASDRLVDKELKDGYQTFLEKHEE